MSVLEPFVLGKKNERIVGIVELPEEGESFPVVVMLHGFGGDHITSAFKFPRLARKLVEKGIATVRFDFRGSGNSEGDFVEVSPNTECRDAIEIIDWVRKADWFDGRLSLLGYSLGGMISSLVAGRRKDIHSICMWAPAIMNRELFGEAYKQFERELEKNGYLDYRGLKLSKIFAEEAVKLDASEELKKHSGSLRIVHGSADETVPYESVKKYATDSSLDFKTIEGAGHKFESEAWLEELFDLTVDFFTEQTK